MIKSHRCCPIGSEQVAVHVWLKDARNDPARIRSADLSVVGLPQYHWATLGHNNDLKKNFYNKDLIIII